MGAHPEPEAATQDFDVLSTPPAQAAASQAARTGGVTGDAGQPAAQEPGAGGWWHALWERLRGRAGAAPGGDR
jgi:hypothetical protein